MRESVVHYIICLLRSACITKILILSWMNSYFDSHTAYISMFTFIKLIAKENWKRPLTRPPIFVRAANSVAEQIAVAKRGSAAQVQRLDFLPKVSRRGHGHMDAMARITNGRIMRNSNGEHRLIPPRARTDLGIHSLSFWLATQWNSLPSELKSCPASHFPKNVPHLSYK
jgi:hypothetical protein